MSEKRIIGKAAVRYDPSYLQSKLILGKLFDNIALLTDKKGWLPTRYEIFEDNCKNLHRKWE